jgi:iron complex outermembrane recepter protein
MALRRICGLALLGISLPGIAAPQQSGQGTPPSGLADASLEDLMNIQVTSVSKKAQPLSSTAASVFVITAEDIRRSGITVLPELLRLAPGVQVARLSSGSWAIGIRGFNDEYSNKLLVLVDGRSVYNQFYSGVFWDELNIPVDNIQRIEVIRGPGAAMWGTNAVNGVINIISKSAKETQGGLAAATGASDGSSSASVRYGGQGPRAYYRVDAENTTYDSFQLLGGMGPSSGWLHRSGDVRLDWDISAKDSLVVSGDVYQSNIGAAIPSATIAAPTAPPTDQKVDTQGSNIVATWQHIFSETSSIEVRFAFQQEVRNDPQILSRIRTLDYGFQQHKLAGSRHDIIWGFSFRDDDFHSTPGAILRLNPTTDARDNFALFAQDDIVLIPNRLRFIAGAQVSHMESVGYAIQPTGRLLWTPTSTLSSWIAVSRAERTPSLADRGLDLYETPTYVPSPSPYIPSLWAVPHITGSPSARSETVLAYEAGERVQASKQISFDFSTFYNVYQHLTSATTGTPTLMFSSGMPYLEIPIVTTNQRHGESYGAELATTWNVTSRWRLAGGYDWLRVETHPYPGDTNIDTFRTSSATPHHQWEVRSNFDLTRTLQIDTAFYYSAAMLQTGIPQHLRADVRIGWRPVPRIELSIGVRDALEANHVEYESTRFNQTSLVPRNFYAKATWRF